MTVISTSLLTNAVFAAPKEIVRRAADLTTTPKGSSPSSLTILNDELYFIATDGVHGHELWKTDGTNTTRLTDICYGTLISFLGPPAWYNGEVYFRAGSTFGNLIDVELWKLSGTNASLVANIRPGTSGSLPSGLTVFNGVLYFTANDGTSGNEFWAYDGFNTYQVADLNPGARNGDPSGYTPFAGSLFFTASNYINGTELHVFDGFNWGMIDLYFGLPSSNPSGFTEFNGMLYFQATDAAAGAELWGMTAGWSASRVAMSSKLVLPVARWWATAAWNRCPAQ